MAQANKNTARFLGIRPRICVRDSIMSVCTLCHSQLVTRSDVAKHIHFCTGLAPFLKLCVLAHQLERAIVVNMEAPLIFDADFRLMIFGKALYERLLDCVADALVSLGSEQENDVTTWAGFDKTYRTAQAHDVLKTFSRELEFSEIIPMNITKQHLLDELRSLRSPFDFAMLSVEQKMLSRTISASGRYMMHLICEINHDTCGACKTDLGDHTCLDTREKQLGHYLSQAIRDHNAKDLSSFITRGIEDLISHIPKRRIYLHIMKTCSFY